MIYLCIFLPRLLSFTHSSPHPVSFAVRVSLNPSSVLLYPPLFRLLARSLLFTRSYSRLTHDHTQSLPRSLHQSNCSFYPTHSRFSHARYLALIPPRFPSSPPLSAVFPLSDIICYCSTSSSHFFSFLVRLGFNPAVPSSRVHFSVYCTMLVCLHAKRGPCRFMKRGTNGMPPMCYTYASCV